MNKYDLGSYTRLVTTNAKDAQTFFDLGLNWTYAYHHEEAIACFESAIQADASCGMAYWGIAYAIGPNYNKAWDDFEEDEKSACLNIVRDAISASQPYLNDLSDVEKALLTAIARRYPHNAAAEDFSEWNDNYANAMRDVYKAFPNDLDVSCLFVEALMNRTPWQLWDLQSGEPSVGADTAEAVTVLECAFNSLEGAWRHPGLLHMYIHVMEMSPHPESALRHGDVLSSLVPDAGHLLHMPTHIDVLCGDYQNVVSRNSAAITADKKTVALSGGENFYAVYRAHNYHFKIYGAMFLGQSAVAMDAARALESLFAEDFLRSMADWFESFVPMKQHVLIRFGKWDDILSQKFPDDPVLYSVTMAMMHYSRTVALANKHQFAQADIERDLFMAALGHVPESRMLFNNSCRDILSIAEQMLLGELEYHKGNHDAAFQHLRQSVEIDDNLPYDEPWGWMQPTRHALGALLIDQGQYEEAESVYRADLGLDNTLSRACQHPANVWSLHGLHECLEHRGDEVEINHIKVQLDRALARTDVSISASCYCRQL